MTRRDLDLSVWEGFDAQMKEIGQLPPEKGCQPEILEIAQRFQSLSESTGRVEMYSVGDQPLEVDTQSVRIVAKRVQLLVKQGYSTANAVANTRDWVERYATP